MNPEIFPSHGLNIKSLFFYKDGFCIKKVDPPLNKETKSFFQYKKVDRGLSR